MTSIEIQQASNTTVIQAEIAHIEEALRQDLQDWDRERTEDYLDYLKDQLWYNKEPEWFYTEEDL